MEGWLIILSVIVVFALLGIIMAFCQAAAEGNVYCPQCKSEECESYFIKQGTRIECFCRDCGHRWIQNLPIKKKE